jgi:integrase
MVKRQERRIKKSKKTLVAFLIFHMKGYLETKSSMSHSLFYASSSPVSFAFLSFAKTFNITFEPPKTRVERKLPFIPTEEELDQLIAGCGKKTATFLQVLKDTGARTAEALKLKWIDIDEKSCIIRINNPVKGSLARAIKVSAKTIAMINALPKTSEYVFNTNQHTLRANFYNQRKKIARKLQNPRLLQIRLHTFRHWKATMEYHKTKNIKWVQQLLGHKKLENTDLYTQLINLVMNGM